MPEAHTAVAGRVATAAFMEQRAEQLDAPAASTDTSNTQANANASVNASTPAAATPSNSNSSSSGGATGRAGGRGAAAIPADHPADACRYPNKRCYNKRAVKNNGQLHKFCEAHRDSANQYQRRLEQRLKQKRIASRLKSLQAQRTQAQAQAAAVVAASGGAVAAAVGGAAGPAPIASGTQNVLAVHYAVNQGVGFSEPPLVVSQAIAASSVAMSIAMAQAIPPPVSMPDSAPAVPEYEPFRFPVPLEDEDIECLYWLFYEP